MDFLRKRLATPRAALWSCFALNFLNYLDRQIPYALSERLKTEFALTDAQLGFLGSAFLLVYSAAAVPLGFLADRWPRRKMLASCALLWSLATAGAALAQDFASLLFFRALVGIGEAGYAAAAPA
ncbi:MAG: MFS transporter, partial [Bdellovibrionota bacterium]